MLRSQRRAVVNTLSVGVQAVNITDSDDDSVFNFDLNTVTDFGPISFQGDAALAVTSSKRLWILFDRYVPGSLDPQTFSPITFSVMMDWFNFRFEALQASPNHNAITVGHTPVNVPWDPSTLKWSNQPSGSNIENPIYERDFKFRSMSLNGVLSFNTEKGIGRDCGNQYSTVFSPPRNIYGLMVSMYKTPITHNGPTYWSSSAIGSIESVSNIRINETIISTYLADPT